MLGSKIVAHAFIIIRKARLRVLWQFFNSYFRVGLGGEGEDGRGVVGTPLVEQKMVFGFLVLVGGLSFLRVLFLLFLGFKVAKFQSFKIYLI